MATEPRLEFWFDFASTYSYPAALRIDSQARAAGIAIAWRPMLLGPLFQEQGWNDSPFNLYPAKGRYMWRDLERVCEELSIPWKRPSRFPRNGLAAARIACLFQEEAWVAEFVRLVFRAHFADDEDIADEAVLASLLAKAGQASQRVGESQSLASKDKLRAQTARAAELGIFGAPSFTWKGELFWGNDRLESAIAHAKRYA
jgi:2-hydroxychromene-2-carboxylate isomerase